MSANTLFTQFPLNEFAWRWIQSTVVYETSSKEATLLKLCLKNLKKLVTVVVFSCCSVTNYHAHKLTQIYCLPVSMSQEPGLGPLLQERVAPQLEFCLAQSYVGSSIGWKPVYAHRNSYWFWMILLNKCVRGWRCYRLGKCQLSS
jgi:hypothetical protein